GGGFVARPRRDGRGRGRHLPGRGVDGRHDARRAPRRTRPRRGARASARAVRGGAVLTATAGSRAALHVQPFAYHAEPGRTPVSVEKQAVLDRIPAGARVLEVGAHTGFFSACLRERGCRVTALEVDPRAAAHAAASADRLVVGDVEDAAVRARLEGPFDVVL